MVPDFQSLMLPVLEFAHAKYPADFANAELREAMAQRFKLSPEDLRELLPSGRQTVIANRVAWAVVHMKHAGLIESARRGFHRITKRGIELLASRPPKVNLRLLFQYPEYKDFRERRSDDAGTTSTNENNSQTPEETLEAAHKLVREKTASELIDRIKQCSPEFFERLVVDLLLKMGYGGSRADAGKAIGRSGDGGVDGIIKQDKLGLDAIYIQAKRWNEQSVGSPEVQQFAGALQGHRATKGVFITTSRFTKEAIHYAARIQNHVVLIDGQQLAEMMIDHNLGVTSVAAYEVKRIDSDYFIDEP